MSDPSDHVARNRAFWDGAAGEWVQPGREWPDGSVEFHLPHGKLIALLRESGGPASAASHRRRHPADPRSSS